LTFKNIKENQLPTFLANRRSIFYHMVGRVN